MSKARDRVAAVSREGRARARLRDTQKRKGHETQVLTIVEEALDAIGVAYGEVLRTLDTRLPARDVKGLVADAAQAIDTFIQQISAAYDADGPPDPESAEVAEFMRRLAALRDAGVARVHLAITEANQRATPRIPKWLAGVPALLIPVVVLVFFQQPLQHLWNGWVDERKAEREAVTALTVAIQEYQSSFVRAANAMHTYNLRLANGQSNGNNIPPDPAAIQPGLGRIDSVLTAYDPAIRRLFGDTVALNRFRQELLVTEEGLRVELEDRLGGLHYGFSGRALADSSTTVWRDILSGVSALDQTKTELQALLER